MNGQQSQNKYLSNKYHNSAQKRYARVVHTVDTIYRIAHRKVCHPSSSLLLYAQNKSTIYYYKYLQMQADKNAIVIAKRAGCLLPHL